MINSSLRSLPACIRHTASVVRFLPGARRRRRLAAEVRLPGGYRRVYFYHIRKTAGTSLSHAFFALDGSNPTEVQKAFSKRGWGIRNEHVFVIHSRYLAEQGNYFYAYSHRPAHQLSLPPNTFRITCLRDPADRVISHYRNLMHYRRHGIGRRTLPLEDRWLGRHFSDFLRNIPRQHLLRQLFMFSSAFDVAQAADRIAELEAVLFAASFGDDLAELSDRLQLSLREYRSKSHYDPVEISPADRERLVDLLQPEYELLHLIEAQRGGRQAPFPQTARGPRGPASGGS